MESDEDGLTIDQLPHASYLYNLSAKRKIPRVCHGAGGWPSVYNDYQTSDFSLAGGNLAGFYVFNVLASDLGDKGRWQSCSCAPCDYLP